MRRILNGYATHPPRMKLQTPRDSASDIYSFDYEGVVKVKKEAFAMAAPRPGFLGRPLLAANRVAVPPSQNTRKIIDFPGVGSFATASIVTNCAVKPLDLSMGI